MTGRAAVAHAAVHLVDNDFLVALVFEDGSRDVGAFDVGSAEFGFRAFAHAQNLVEGDGVAGLRVLVTVHEEHITFGDDKLAALCLNGCFHFGKWENRLKKRITGPMQEFLC